MIHTQGKLIVIEGTDGAGKGTQSALLLEALSKKRSVSFFDFPRYKKSRFGQLIKRSLSGEFGDFLALSPYLSSLPYMLDRARAKDLLVEALKDGDVICDRYVSSNLAHQTVKLPKNKRKDFIEFVEEGEYKEIGMPMPDLVVCLYIPADISQNLMTERARKNKERKIDIHEGQPSYQAQVIQMYKELASKRKTWHVVECVDKKGQLLSREAIHQKVLQIVKKTLKIRV
ncbi:MAG: thymidylate kinase, dTMP kinase [Parcubacteria group bacterium]|nr:thymidylate kinase, dTMP kinase [Parcubacteria group bacterium]